MFESIAEQFVSFRGDQREFLQGRNIEKGAENRRCCR
jgi:hypothetical protein